MTDKNNRPNHIEDVLVTLGRGNWFGWTDSKNKIYANLIIHPKIWDQNYTGNIHEEGMIDTIYTKPSEQELIDKLTELQTEYDAQDYARKRKTAYPDIYEYMDGIVKNDQTQIDKYIADSQAVKARYKKG